MTGMHPSVFAFLSAEFASLAVESNQVHLLTYLNFEVTEYHMFLLCFFDSFLTELNIFCLKCSSECPSESQHTAFCFGNPEVFHQDGQTSILCGFQIAVCDEITQSNLRKNA